MTINVRKEIFCNGCMRRTYTIVLCMQAEIDVEDSEIMVMMMVRHRLLHKEGVPTIIDLVGLISTGYSWHTLACICRLFVSRLMVVFNVLPQIFKFNAA